MNLPLLVAALSASSPAPSQASVDASRVEMVQSLASRLAKETGRTGTARGWS
ncbi:MAG: hypothetical protein ACO1SV_19040 [Fimbriimonas sp.]